MPKFDNTFETTTIVTQEKVCPILRIYSTSTYKVLALLRWKSPTTKLSVSSSYVMEHNFSPPLFFKSLFKRFKNASPFVPAFFLGSAAFFPAFFFAAFFLASSPPRLFLPQFSLPSLAF